MTTQAACKLEAMLYLRSHGVTPRKGMLISYVVGATRSNCENVVSAITAEDMRTLGEWTGKLPKCAASGQTAYVVR